MKLILLPASLYLLFHLLGWYYPAWLWGVDQLHYYPTSLAVTCSALGAAALVVAAHPSWSLRLDQCAYRLAQHLTCPPWSRTWFKSILLALLVVLAYTFRVREHLLGDSSMWFSHLGLALEGTQREAVTWVNATGLPGLEYVPLVEPLDYLIHLQAYQLGRRLFSWTAQDTYEWLSCLAGLLYAWVLWRLNARIHTAPLERLTCFALLFFLGSLQLFFGYGESYTLVTLAVALYLLAALRCLQGAGRLALPTLCLVLASGLHLMALSLLPSWLFLWWYKRGRPWSALLQGRHRYLLLAAVGVAGLLLYTAFYPHRLPWWTALESGKYALLSLPHALLFFNAFLLVSPFGLLWGCAALMRRVPSSPAFVFAGWAFFGASGLVWLHDAYLGGRDWDLLSFPGLPGALWGCLGLGLLPEAGRHFRQVRLAVLPLMLLHTGLWIGINADKERAVDRLGNLLLHTNQADHYRAFTLGHYYLNIRKDTYAPAIQYFRQAIDLAPADEPELKARYYKYLGKTLAYNKEYGPAADAFGLAYTQRRETLVYTADFDFYRSWAWSLAKSGEEQYLKGEDDRAQQAWKEGVALCRQLLAAKPEADLWHLLGQVLTALEQFNQAADAFRQVITLEPTPAKRRDAYLSLGAALQELGDREGAATALQEADHLQVDR